MGMLTTKEVNEISNSTNSDCLINQNVWYTIYSTMVSFFIPLSVMLFMYYKIYREASKFSLKEANRKRCLKAHEQTATPPKSPYVQLPKKVSSLRTVKNKKQNIITNNENGSNNSVNVCVETFVKRNSLTDENYEFMALQQNCLITNNSKSIKLNEKSVFDLVRRSSSEIEISRGHFKYSRFKRNHKNCSKRNSVNNSESSRDYEIPNEECECFKFSKYVKSSVFRSSPKNSHEKEENL